MNTRLLQATPDALAPRSGFSRKAAATLRSLLRATGVCLYHLGLARAIINLSPERIRTLLYHAVEEQPGSHTAGLGMSISPGTFSRHLDYYRRHYNVVSMQELVRGRLAPRTAVLTFDDGYASVGENAVPALEKRGMPATIYLIGKAVDGGMVWVNQLNHALNRHPKATMTLIHSMPGLANIAREDVLQHVQTTFPPQMIEQLMARLEKVAPPAANAAQLFLNREQISELKTHGMSFGFHSNDHYNLRLCSEQTLRQQLDSSALDDLLDSRTFAYPFGYCGDREADRLEARGFQRTMLVQEQTPHPRKSNLMRSEPTGSSAARVFAQLEVEEPLMRWLRSALA
ncbi:polysaccharide deacetylase family protein [Granulosicoccus sp. 3-233]|uniref:polysaccharide deacetylase family protein n=1 Tax=Granulosicoccus sp. 3-233 TaxID=3417969 RepID=UPI003D348653